MEDTDLESSETSLSDSDFVVALLFGNSDYDSDDNVLEEDAIAMLSTTLDTRETYYARQRLIWYDHVQRLRRERQFDRMYRMDELHFDQLLRLLSPRLSVDGTMSTRRTGVAAISEEVVLHCTLRYMAGGSYLDVRDVAHISISSFYRCLHKGITAILACTDLAIKLPANKVEIDRAANSFKRESSEGVLDGCVGCVDGMLIKIMTPSYEAVGNVRAYFSGHYHHMGLNIQAACDHRCRFIYFSVAAPGGSSDLWAYARTELSDYVDSLGDNRYFIGDGAYIPSEHMLTPFGGSKKLSKAHDTYDFYISQLRIKIEQTFGRFTNKWRCLQSPMALKLKNASRAIMAMARLYNFCTDLGESFLDAEAREADLSDVSSGDHTLTYLPSEPADSSAISLTGTSDLRDRIVDFIGKIGLARPYRNLARRSTQT